MVKSATMLRPNLSTPLAITNDKICDGWQLIGKTRLTGNATTVNFDVTLGQYLNLKLFFAGKLSTGGNVEFEPQGDNTSGWTEILKEQYAASHTNTSIDLNDDGMISGDFYVGWVDYCKPLATTYGAGWAPMASEAPGGREVHGAYFNYKVTSEGSYFGGGCQIMGNFSTGDTIILLGQQ
jgi:hypothetical protein